MAATKNPAPAASCLCSQEPASIPAVHAPSPCAEVWGVAMVTCCDIGNKCLSLPLVPQVLLLKALDDLQGDRSVFGANEVTLCRLPGHLQEGGWSPARRSHDQKLGTFSPVLCGSVGWVSFCKAKGRWLDSRSNQVVGSVPSQGACERQPIIVCLSHRCFSPSLSPSLPLSLKINKIVKKGKKNTSPNGRERE